MTMTMMTIIKKDQGERWEGHQRGGGPLDDDDELQTSLDLLRGNVVLPQNTPEQNSKIIQRQNSEKFFNRKLRQREKQLSSLPIGNVGKKRSSIKSSLKFRLPENPPATPMFDDYWDGVADQWIPHNTPLSGLPEPPALPLFDYERDFPPLSRSVLRASFSSITPKTPLPPLPSTPRETSFLSPAEESVSSLCRKLPSIAPVPSRLNINDFSRPITDITDEKINTISITPKKAPLPPHRTKTIITRIK